MMLWYRRVFNETDQNRQIVIIADACNFYEDQYEEALETTKPPKGSVVQMEMKLPGLAAENQSRVYDLQIMLKHLENIENTVRVKKTQYYMEHYQRKLSETVAKGYAEVDDEVQTIRAIRFRVSSVCDLFIAISKGYEFMHFQLTNYTKLKAAGLEDAEF